MIEKLIEALAPYIKATKNEIYIGKWILNQNDLSIIFKKWYNAKVR